MEEKTILELETKRDQDALQRRNFSERVSRIEGISHLLLKPRGLFRKRCPLCRQRIKACFVGRTKYYHCPCGYEYALWQGYEQ